MPDPQDCIAHKIVHKTYLVQIRAVSMLQQRYDTRIYPAWCFHTLHSRWSMNFMQMPVFYRCVATWNGTPRLKGYVIVKYHPPKTLPPTPIPFLTSNLYVIPSEANLEWTSFQLVSQGRPFPLHTTNRFQAAYWKRSALRNEKSGLPDSATFQLRFKISKLYSFMASATYQNRYENVIIMHHILLVCIDIWVK